MRINVTRQVVCNDGERRKTLLVGKNPHEVSDSLGRELIKRKLAVAARQAPAAPAAPVEPVAPSGGTEPSLEALTVPELKDIARDMGIAGYGSMRHAELVDAIAVAQTDDDNEGAD